MGGMASVQSRYDHSESTDIALEDVARAMRLAEEHSANSESSNQNRNHAQPNMLSSKCYYCHPCIHNTGSDVCYRFEKKIGEGAFSTVYKASLVNKEGQIIMDNFSDDPDQPNWRPLRFAIKEIELQNLSLQQLQNVEKEIQILSQLNHSDIVRMISVYLCSPDEKNERKCISEPKVGAPIDLVSRKGLNSQLFIVLEYLRGGELLKAVCQRKRYDEDDARELLKQIIQGIRYIHSRGVIHRDIKPENLILSKKSLDSGIKIVDFGFATLITDQDKQFKEGKMIRSRSNSWTSCDTSSDVFNGMSEEQRKKYGFLCGTPGYIAPEVLSERKYTTKCDMWAAGVVMFILLSGTMPFAVNDNDSVLRGRYSYPPSRWQNVSELAKDMIDKLLTVDFEVRLSAEEALAHPWMNTKTVTLDLLVRRKESLASLETSNTDEVLEEILSQSLATARVSSEKLGSITSAGEDSYISQASQASTGELTQNLKTLKRLTIRQKFRRGLTAVRSSIRFKTSGLIRERRRSENQALATGLHDNENAADNVSAKENCEVVTNMVNSSDNSERYLEDDVDD